MAASRPVATYALRIPPGDILIPAVPEFAPSFRVTMAAIDPTEDIDIDAEEGASKPRATLKLVRVPDMDDDDDDDEDDFDLDDDEDSDDEELNGGPSVKKSKKALSNGAAEEDSDESMDEADIADAIKKIMAKSKGKSKAADEDDDDEDDEDLEIPSDDDDESLGMDECVLCTLDTERTFQQPLDFHVAEGERIFFKVSGNLTVHLTGNYVMSLDDDEDDEEDADYDEDEYDLSPNEDELDGLDALLDGEESDDLDDLDDPRITELAGEEKPAPAAAVKKGKNKRPADSEPEDDSTLDAMITDSLKSADAEPAKKLTKAEKKAAKKLKNNEGAAAAAPEAADKKKVQFAKNLEQGPTPSKADNKKDAAKDDKKAASISLGIKDVKGVSVDDRKIGSGPAAKKGSRVEMRYIGKLDNGKVFDSNKSGKPFAFKLGIGEVIQGWDIGLTGISSGGERRLIIPAHLAYGKKALPGIPANSKLTFDVKCLSVK